MAAIEPVGEHTARMWEAAEEPLARIADLSFVQELGAGTLPPESFTYWIQQDSHYLVAYQKAMVQLAAKAPDSRELRFWANSARQAVAEEQAMQEALLSGELFQGHVVDDLGVSLETSAYSTFLLASAAHDPYAVAAAAVLPCYWVFAEAGANMRAAVGDRDLASHPYGAWIEIYSDTSFHAVARKAARIVEAACEAAGPAERERAVEAFRVATRFEELFFAQGATAPEQRVMV